MVPLPFRIRDAIQHRGSLAGELEIGALFVLILSTFGNGMNYLFQIVMGRMLSVEDFGTLNALLSVFMMTSVPLGVVTALIAKFVVEYRTTDQRQLVGVFIFRMLRTSLIGFVGLCIIGFPLSALIARFLNITSINLVQIVVGLIALNLLYAAAIGVVQGLKRFIALGVFGSLFPTIKLGLSVFLVWLGYEVFGALTAFGLAIFFTIVIVVVYIHRICTVRNEAMQKLDRAAYVRFFFSAFLLSLGMAFVTNMDMIFIKHYLPEAGAGLYSPAMVFGRILLYAPAALVQVMYPLTVEAHAVSPRSTHKLILRVLLFSTIIMVLCIIPLVAYGELALSLVFGEKYLEAAKYILPACLFVIPVSYLTVFINFAMGVDRTRFLTTTLAVGCVLSIVLVHLFHTGVVQVLMILTMISTAIVLVNGVYLAVKYLAYSSGEGQPI